jgi:2-aminoadipate transaminase
MQKHEGQSDPLEALIRESCSDPEVISFAGGFPATESIPQDELAQAAIAAVRTLPRVEASLQYCWPEGKPALREWVARRLRARGAEVSPDRVIITAGAQQGLSLAFKQIVRSGMTASVDTICYPGALDLLRRLGATLRAGSDAHAPDLAYVMPGISNPTGADTTPEQWARLRDLTCPIVADEAYAELRFDGKLPPVLLAEAPERVFHVGTVSKTLCPGLRVGWLVPPAHALAGFLQDKTLDDLQAGTLAQSLLVGLLRRLDYEGHLEEVRALYRARAECMVRELRRRLPELDVSVPEGGFSVFVDTGIERDELAFMKTCVRAGVLYDPGTRYQDFPERPASLALRLCFSALEERAIVAGVERLASALHAFRSRAE